MVFNFVNYKSDTSYITLLSKIAFKYCDNCDGRIYATYCINDISENAVEIIINQLTPFVINKKNSVILNLLVNPFFNDLCDYLSNNPKISINRINLIKKYVFSYLSDENTKIVYSDLDVEGADLYIKQNMYLRSKKMLERL